MGRPDFPWRPLGQLLVDRGLLLPADLEYALQVQKTTQRLLGEILVTRKFISAKQLVDTLAEQHGLRIEDASTLRSRLLAVPDAPHGLTEGGTQWRPLGRVLVDKGLITESGLQRALIEQKQTGHLLGEILVNRGWVSAGDVALALAEQHGLEAAPDGNLQASVNPDVSREDDSAFEVRGTAASDSPLFTSATFLDATDFAFDLLDDQDPEALEIVKVGGGGRETVWSYSREAAAGRRPGVAVARRQGDDGTTPRAPVAPEGAHRTTSRPPTGGGHDPAQPQMTG